MVTLSQCEEVIISALGRREGRCLAWPISSAAPSFRRMIAVRVSMYSCEKSH